MKYIISIILVLAGFIGLWLLNKPRLEAYDKCYMQNYQEWGSCKEL